MNASASFCSPESLSLDALDANREHDKESAVHRSFPGIRVM